MTQNNIIFYNLDVSKTACVRLMHVELTFESSICNLSSRENTHGISPLLVRSEQERELSRNLLNAI